MAINLNGVRVRPATVAPEPSPPTDSLGAWWRADDAGTVNGANVTSWTDRSQYTQTVTVPGGVTAPTWQASVANLGNRPAVQFAANQGLQLLSPSGFLAGTAALTVYAVLEIDTFTASALPFYYGPVNPGTFGDDFGLIALNGPDRIGNSIYGGSALVTTTGSAKIVQSRAASNSQWGNSILTINGEIPSSVSYANPTTVLNIPSPVGMVGIGGLTGLWDFRGRIAEVLYYSKNHSGNERAKTFLYLSERYGIPLD